MVDSTPLRFIDEPITVEFKGTPILEKTPTCPDGFIWQGIKFEIEECINEWRDFRRRGRMARNMRDEHLKQAATKGSWGVGRFFFRVMVKQGRIFDLYYDRAVKDVYDRKGNWYLFSERRP